MLAAVALAASGCGGASRASAPGLQAGSLSPFQERILADGRVTRAEIESAYDAVVACLVDAGNTEVFWERETERTYAVQGVYGPPMPGESVDEAADRYDRSWDECDQQFVAAVSDAWLRQTEVSEEEKQAAVRELAACVEPYGIRVTGYDVEGLRLLLERLNELDRAGDQQAAEAVTLNDCYRSFSLVAGGSPD